MMEQPRTAAYLGAGFVLTIVALSGWGAFAYSLSSARQAEQALREALARQQQLASDFGQVQADLTRSRQALERAQADLIAARAEIDQLKTRQPPPAVAPASTANPPAVPRTRQGR